MGQPPKHHNVFTVKDSRVASGGGEGARRDVGPGGEDLVAEGVQGRRRRRRRDVGDEVGRRRRGERRCPLGPNSIDTFQLGFQLEKPLEFWGEIPYTKKMFKMGSLDMSQNQNGISIRFSSRNSGQNVFY